jgi:hypothetical protein
MPQTLRLSAFFGRTDELRPARRYIPANPEPPENRMGPEMTTKFNPEEAAIHNLLQRLYAAWADNDAEAFAAHYRDDA